MLPAVAAASQGNVAALTVLGSWNQEQPPKTSSADSPDSATVDSARTTWKSRYSEEYMSPEVLSGKSAACMTARRRSRSASSRLSWTTSVGALSTWATISRTNGVSQDLWK